MKLDLNLRIAQVYNFVELSLDPRVKLRIPSMVDG